MLSGVIDDGQLKIAIVGRGNGGYYGGHVVGCGVGNRRCW